MNNNMLIIVLGGIVTVVIAAMTAITLFAPESTGVIVQIVGFAVLALPVFVGLKLTIESKAVSEENKQQIAAVASQTGHGLEAVKQQVDGHMTAMREEVRRGQEREVTLLKEIAGLKQDRAVKAVETNQQETATSQILTAIAAIPVALPVETPLEPPTETPSHAIKTRLPGDHL